MQKFIAAALAATSLAGAVVVTAAPTEASAQPYGYGRHYGGGYRHYGHGYRHRFYRPYRHYGYGYRHRFYRHY